MALRGRPRKIQPIVVEPNTIQWDIAKILSEYCGVPGCSPRNHFEAASRIIEVINKRSK
jgi:hypothetical protein